MTRSSNSKKERYVVSDIPKDKIRQLERALNRSNPQNNMSSAHRHELIRRYTGIGLVCQEIPTKIVSSNVSDDESGPGTRIERYCKKCFDRWIKQEKGKATLLRATNGLDKTYVVKVKTKTKSVKGVLKTV